MAKVEFYTGWLGKIRWKITGNNNERIDASTQGFASKQMAQNNMRVLYEALKEYYGDNGKLCTKELCEPGLCEACKPN